MLSQWELAEPFYRWVKENHPTIKRVAAISPNDTSGKDTNTAVVKALKALGFEVVADEYYERGTKDFYPVLTKILAQKPDMIDVAAAPAGEAGLILKQAMELGFKGAKGWTAGTNSLHHHQRGGPGGGGGRVEPGQHQRQGRPRQRRRAEVRRDVREALRRGARRHRRGQLRRLRRLHPGHAEGGERRPRQGPGRARARSASTPCGARWSSAARRPTASTGSSCIPWSSARCAGARSVDVAQVVPAALKKK